MQEQHFLLKNQVDWCVNEDNKFMADHILKLENINEDYKMFCKIYGIKENGFILKNKGNHGNYKKYYTKESKEIIKKLNMVDIEKFKYTF